MPPSVNAVKRLRERSKEVGAFGKGLNNLKILRFWQLNQNRRDSCQWRVVADRILGANKIMAIKQRNDLARRTAVDRWNNLFLTAPI